MLLFNLRHNARKVYVGFLLTLFVSSLIHSPIWAQVPVVWPMQDGSHEMLTGFCDGLGYIRTEFHAGIDIAGPEKVVVAARPGIIKKKGPANMGNYIVIEVDLGDGKVAYNSYGHLDPDPQKITDKVKDDFVAMGEPIGTVVTMYVPRSENHCHFSVWRDFVEPDGWSADKRNHLNPFSIFTKDEDRDPQGKNPALEDNNGDGRAIFFEKEGKMAYIESPIYGNIDILVETSDDMSPGLLHNQGVHSIGYWIENLIGGGANIKNEIAPYILCTLDDNWFIGTDPGISTWTKLIAHFSY